VIVLQNQSLDQALIALVAIELHPVIFALLVQLGVGEWTGRTGRDNRLQGLGFASRCDGGICVMQATRFNAADSTVEMSATKCEGVSRGDVAG